MQFRVNCIRGLCFSPMLPFANNSLDVLVRTNIAEELGLSVGESLLLLTEESMQEYIVCGIYSDITNGGKTAKAAGWRAWAGKRDNSRRIAVKKQAPPEPRQWLRGRLFPIFRFKASSLIPMASMRDALTARILTPAS